jgi:hypothetical protein
MRLSPLACIPDMWSDDLFRAEQLHLLRILFWAASSVLAGTALLVFIVAARRGSALVRHFALQTAIWGALELLMATSSYHTLALRDVAGSARLERSSWLWLGLYCGVVASGITLAVAAWSFAVDRSTGPSVAGKAGSSHPTSTGSGPGSLSGIGAGIGIAVQGLALAVLQLFLVAHLSQ